LIGKIIAGDLREIASRLYKVAVTRPWTRPCHWREPYLECHYNRVVHYQLRGNAADSHFVHDSSFLSEHASEDES